MASALASSSTTMATIPIHQAVTIRLNKTNYLLWRAQILPFLRSTKLLKHLDGSAPAPPKMVATSTTAGATTTLNPEYERWHDRDQQLLSGLLSSMTEDVLRDVITAATAKDAWDILQRKFASSTRARTVQI
jgi:hypothetical protein